MNRLYEIRRNNGRWEFSSEAALEDFVWNHLEQLFSLKPLKRQYFIDGNICDILALSSNGKLIVIELKNAEDRYVIQQLTRYYDALLKKKPLSDQIDYEIPVELIILSPSFHEDNLIDQKYNVLDFKLFRFSITGDSRPRIRLENLNHEDTVCEIEIPFLLQEQSTDRLIPFPVKAFNNALARCPDYDSSLILSLREKILRFDERIEENQVKPGFFMYGKGKTKYCADFSTRKLTFIAPPHEYPVFALQLPISFGDKYRFSRVTLPSNIFLINQVHALTQEFKGKYGGAEFTEFRQRGFGRTQETTKTWGIRIYLWYFLQKESGIYFDMDDLLSVLHKYCHDRGLPDASESNSNLLNFLVQISLEKWLERLEV